MNTHFGFEWKTTERSRVIGLAWRTEPDLARGKLLLPLPKRVCLLVTLGRIKHPNALVDKPNQKMVSRPGDQIGNDGINCNH